MSEDFFNTVQLKIKNPALQGRLGRALSVGFDYQMWCLGCDIKRQEGNLLLDFGFKKESPPFAEFGSSRYTLAIEKCGCLYLWGFAALLTFNQDCLCLKRFEKMPRYSNTDESLSICWHPSHLPHIAFPKNEEQIARATQLLSLIAQQFLKYEEYVVKVTPYSYRKTCLARKPNQNSFLRKIDMKPIDLWRTLVVSM
jgi:hypothetical protein